MRRGVSLIACRLWHAGTDSMGCAMMRWLAGVSGLLLTMCLATGCKQQLFLSEECFREAHCNLLPHPEQVQRGALMDPLQGPIAPPPDVNTPERPPFNLSLEQAFALALENGLASARGASAQGQADNTLVQFNGGSLNGQTDRVRVLSLAPAIAQAAIEQGVARFDPVFASGFNYATTDEQPQGLSSFQNGSSAGYFFGVGKALASGGVVGMGMNVDYRLLAQPPANNFSVLNPNYTVRGTIGIELPLGRDSGVELNQLLGRAPTASSGALPNPLAQGFNSIQSTRSLNEGILISRLRFDQSRIEFERNIHNLIVNVEVAYWRLYQAYGRLYSFEEITRIALESWRINYAKYQAGAIGAADFQPIRGQYEEFRGERLAALADVLVAERNLRGLLGMPVEDGTRLIPVTPPTLAKYHPDWSMALNDALRSRPELALARENMKFHEYQVRIAENSLRPDIRAFANIQSVGSGTRLDGDGTLQDGQNIERPSNAFRSFVSGHFADWTLGVNMNVPLGYRFETAALRQSRLARQQAYLLLRDQEERATRVLAEQYQELARWQELIEMRRNERKAYAESVEARFKKYAAGQTTIDGLLEVQRRMVLAQVKEYEAIAEYNNTLARFEFARGTILRNNNVHIAEGPLPVCAQVRAVENEKDRTEAYVLRHRPDPFNQPGRLCLKQDFPNADKLTLERPLPMDVTKSPTVDQDKTDHAENVAPTITPKVLREDPSTIVPVGVSDAPIGGVETLGAGSTGKGPREALKFRQVPAKKIEGNLPEVPSVVPTLEPLPAATTESSANVETSKSLVPASATVVPSGPILEKKSNIEMKPAELTAPDRLEPILPRNDPKTVSLPISGTTVVPTGPMMPLEIAPVVLPKNGQITLPPLPQATQAETTTPPRATEAVPPRYLPSAPSPMIPVLPEAR